MPDTGTAPHILVFDSGIGGLTVFDEIRRALPTTALSYAMDTANFPYGTKSESWLKKEVPHLLHSMSAEVAADIVVVACNSASTIALDDIRQVLDVPVVGTVPAVKPAAGESKTGVIGVLATPGTVARQYTKDLISDFAPTCEVLLQGSAELVDLAERKARGETFEQKEVAVALAPLFAQDTEDKMDIVVLACTHFPFLLPELRTVAPRALQWIDSGTAIAARVLSIAEMIGAKNEAMSEGSVITTGTIADIAPYRSLFSERTLTRGVTISG